MRATRAATTTRALRRRPGLPRRGAQRRPAAASGLPCPSCSRPSGVPRMPRDVCSRARRRCAQLRVRSTTRSTPMPKRRGTPRRQRTMVVPLPRSRLQPPQPSQLPPLLSCRQLPPLLSCRAASGSRSGSGRPTPHWPTSSRWPPRSTRSTRVRSARCRPTASCSRASSTPTWASASSTPSSAPRTSGSAPFPRRAPSSTPSLCTCSSPATPQSPPRSRPPSRTFCTPALRTPTTSCPSCTMSSSVGRIGGAATRCGWLGGGSTVTRSTRSRSP
mmetsp:Transcript_36502/g.91040  ORF Transcript_36502/g.91040 Transcript_36502/m.91040 type:complete len:274 (-) Transcript_36502:189-1010(-)